jgi:hypothetical protein
MALKVFIYNVFQLPNRTPSTPVRASWARWVRVRVHVILLGMVGHVFCGNCTINIVIQNKRKYKHE